ncbi:MAG: DcaP family trimeric outer membrane transporter [Planctomycetota bacterium]|jgi:hypothetical protein
MLASSSDVRAKEAESATPQEESSQEPQEEIPTEIDEQEGDSDELEDLKRTIEEQRTRLEEQDKLSEAQREEIESLRGKFDEMKKQLEEQGKLSEEQRQQIEEMNQLLLSVHNRVQEMKDKPPDYSISGALEERLKQIEASTQKEDVEIPVDVVSAGEFPGSLRIPGTDAAIKLGGSVRFSTVYTFDDLKVDDQFITAEIPVGSAEAGQGARLNMSGRASRLNVDIRTPTGVGHMRAFIEGDFADEGDTFRLRHAFGQYKRTLVGKTWSAMADPQASPEDIDFEGLNSRNLVRQAQIRFGVSMDDDKTFAFSLEDPESDITGGESVNLMPDMIARFRWEKPYGPLGHLQMALILRQLRAEADNRPTKTLREIGYGMTVSGKLAVASELEKDNIVFQINSGDGMGRYINDLESEGGQDAFIDPVTNRMRTLAVFSIYAAYQHWWTETTRSSLLYGFVFVDNVSNQPDDAYTRTNRIALNVVWSPIPRLDLGIEYLYGNRENKDDSSGHATQAQFAATFWF